MDSFIVSKIKTNVFNLEIELKEQNNFLDNEKDNVRELQHHIDCEENDYRCVLIRSPEWSTNQAYS
jgi:FtsZ-binding cell division protein ZapB